MMEDYQEKLISLFQEMETKLGVVYGEFEKKFPDEAEFWSAMRLDEERHVRWVGELARYAKTGEIAFIDGRTRTYTIGTIVDGIEKAIEKAMLPGFSIMDALTFAKNIEMALVEKNVFGQFHAKTQKQKDLMLKLSHAIDVHADKTRNKWMEHSLGRHAAN